MCVSRRSLSHRPRRLVREYLRIEHIIEAAVGAARRRFIPVTVSSLRTPTSREPSQTLACLHRPALRSDGVDGIKNQRAARGHHGWRPVVPGTTEPLASLAKRARQPRASASRDAERRRAAAASDAARSRRRKTRFGFGAARSEAAAAFGDDAIYLEKAVERPRHIEIQIFADAHSNVVHLASANARSSAGIRGNRGVSVAD